MKSIGDRLLFSTVRLEDYTNNSFSVGTGFFYYAYNKLFLVTNKHVIDGVIKGRFSMLKSTTDNNEWKPILGDTIQVNFEKKNFIGHPDEKIDVAVANVSPLLNALKEKGVEPFWMHISPNLIPAEKDTEIFFTPAEEIYFVGYPNGLWDDINNLPIIRKGITATPYYINFKDEKKFLIDASVFPGSSGSPVFIYYKGTFSDKFGKIYEGNKLYFIGIISKTYLHYSESINSQNINSQMIDLGEVFKAETIEETISYYLELHK